MSEKSRIKQIEHGYDVLRTTLHRSEQVISIIADRLESWAEAHHACAMRMSEGEDCRAQMNLRDNYRNLANLARSALSDGGPQK